MRCGNSAQSCCKPYFPAWILHPNLMLEKPMAMATTKESVVDINGRRLKLSNLDKVLYPAVGFTKGQVIDYYVRIAPVLVPQLKGRPLTMKRYPGGVDQEYFYEKNAPSHRPDWVKTAPVWSDGNNRTM